MPSDRELDQLDRLIDASLPGYSQAEPRPGFERRVLACARAERRFRLSPFAGWALAVPAIGCLLLVLVIRHNTGASHREPQPQTAAASIPGKSAPAIIASGRPPVAEISTKSRKSARPVSQQALPKQDVFPTPSPLTNEERAIVAFSPIPAQLPMPPDSSISQIDPIHIAELQIKPLEVKTFDISDSIQSNPSKDQP